MHVWWVRGGAASAEAQCRPVAEPDHWAGLGYRLSMAASVRLRAGIERRMRVVGTRYGRRLTWLYLLICAAAIIGWAVVYALTLRGLGNEDVAYWFFSDYHFQLWDPWIVLLWLPAFYSAIWWLVRSSRGSRRLRIPVSRWPFVVLALLGVVVAVLPDFMPHSQVLGSLVRTSNGYLDISPPFQGRVPREAAVSMLNSELRRIAQFGFGSATSAAAVCLAYLLRLGPRS